jgi:predicted anti-sigma-YlaC factor YlaD
MQMSNEIFQKLKWMLILWLARRLPDCRQMTQRVGESLDRRMNLRDRILIKLHLFTCEACERYLEQVTFLKEALHVHGEREPDRCEFSTGGLSEESKKRRKLFLKRSVNLSF